MLRDVRDPVRPRLTDHQAEEAVAARRRPDRGPLLGGDPARDEAFDPPARVDDAERRVSRVHEIANAVHDQLEDPVQVQLAGDCPRCAVERVDRGDDGEVRTGSLGERPRDDLVGHPQSVAAAARPAPSRRRSVRALEPCGVDRPA